MAVHPKLNDQINVFIALAPAMSPAGLSNGVVDALVKASPQVLFLLFGRRSILSSATMWESLLYPPLFVKLIDLALTFLFNWRTQNISMSQKLAAYPHLYSFTSTKSVVHWFQIIRTKSFQMYDDDVPPLSPLSSSGSRKYTKVARYPTRNIRTPIVLVYGGSDSLVDIKAMLRELPPQTIAAEIPHYEHLDFLWARDVHEQVFSHVFDALESFTGPDHTREEYARYQIARQNSDLAARTSAVSSGGRRGGSSSAVGKTMRRTHMARISDVVDRDVSTAVGGCSTHEEEEEEDDENESEVGGGGGSSTLPGKASAAEAGAGTETEDSGSASPPRLGDAPPVADAKVAVEQPENTPPPSRAETSLPRVTVAAPLVLQKGSSSPLSPDSMRGGKGISLGASM